MRIRKHAAKLLLGSACPPPQQYSPPPPPPQAPAADDEYDLQSVGDDGLFLCQLNCSPWDVLDLNDCNHFYFQHQQEEEDEGKGISGNVLGFADEEDIFGISEAITKSSSVVVAAQPYFNFNDDEEEDGIDRRNNVKKRRRRKKKEKENRGVDGHESDDRYSKSSCVVTVAKSTGRSVATGICKKNDGKGWHCNRPANPNHTLCDHHLTQLKSYSSNRYNNNSIAAIESEPNATTREVKNPDHVRSPVKHRKRKTKAVAAASDKSDGDGYYYYSGFGLGKTRSNGRKEDSKAKELAGKNESESGDGSDAPIAGDDLDEDAKTVGNIVDNNNKGINRRKKRGRKPIKARSLKSLL